MVSRKLLLYLANIGASLAASWIVPGAVWTDTDGNKIDAHGGAIYQESGTFYWIGQSLDSNVTPRLYSSTDLLNWKNLGLRSSVDQYWRPKLVKMNSNYWLFGQVNRYVQPLESSTLLGTYTATLPAEYIPPHSYSYSDTGLFQDTDGTYYLLTSCDHNIVQVNKINTSGTIGTEVNYLSKGAYEAPGMLHVNDKYFLIVSSKTGYRSNPNKMFYATSLTGSWTGPYDIAPEVNNTYNSQNTFELTVKGSQQTTYIYMGDAWLDNGGDTSNYVWLPMTVDTGTPSVTLNYHAMWKVDVNTGLVSYPTTKKRYEAENALLSGRAVRNSEVVFENITGTGTAEWIGFHYRVNSPQNGEAYIQVNDDPERIYLSSLNALAGHRDYVPVKLTLEPGDVNTIVFGVTGSEDFEVVLDGIEIYEDEL